MNDSRLEAAAQWWSDRVQERTLGDPKLDGAMNGIYARQHAAIQPEIVITEEQLARFREAIRTTIRNVPAPYSGLMFDYHPSLNLAQALDIAGIPPEVLGGKMSMVVYRDHVTARIGYGADDEIVWQQHA